MIKLEKYTDTTYFIMDGNKAIGTYDTRDTKVVFTRGLPLHVIAATVHELQLLTTAIGAIIDIEL